MREFVRIMILIAIGFVLALSMQQRRIPDISEPHRRAQRIVFTDTVKVFDTVVSRKPEASGITTTGRVVCRMAVVNPGSGAGGKPRSCDSVNTDQCDSATVEIPLETVHYADSNYEAWVSGYHPRLDSIRVYRRMETVTIREYKPPDRWHLGISAGYGYTPSGFRPYIGIGISYSIISW